jgi:hypothetical protein
MGTEIKSWQIIGDKLEPINTTLEGTGETERYHLEPWLASNPEIIGDDIAIIGRQVSTKSGSIDLLGIDKAGNTVIIELKRGELPRESIAQAIDYASDVAGWTVERLDEVCLQYTKKSLEETLGDAFDDEVALENLDLNTNQRILLVGFAIESSLERMIEWLSEACAVSVNAIVLSYVKTKSGDKLLTRTSIISEEVEQERRRKRNKPEMSDALGSHEVQQLKQLLLDYLARDNVTNRRIRDILLPACFRMKVLTRDQLKKEFLDFDPNYDESKVGYSLTGVSNQLGIRKNDFLRQVIAYEYPRHHWEKDNFSIRDQYRDLVKEVLDELKAQ